MAHLSATAAKQIEEIIARYKDEKTPLMMILSDIQKEYGSFYNYLRQYTKDEIRNEIDKTNNAIRNVIGVNPTLLRPPYGSVNDRVNSLTDMNIILWNVDTLDWKYKNAERVKDEIMEKVFSFDEGYMNLI